LRGYLVSVALDTFNEVIVRAKSMLDMSDQVDLDEDLKSDIVRGSLVLAVAGFDRYFTHKFVDLLATFLKTSEISDELVEILGKYGITSKFLLKLLAAQSDRPFRTIRNMIQGDIFYYTTQQTKAIDSLFAKINIRNLTDRVNKKSKSKMMIGRVNKAVFRRHRIVHEADLNMHHRTNKISRAVVENWINALSLFASNSEVIISTLLKENIKGSKISAKSKRQVA